MFVASRQHTISSSSTTALNGRTRLEAHTVVAIVDIRVCDDDVVAAEDVPAIRVLCSVLGCRHCRDCDVPEGDVFRLVYLWQEC